MTNFPSSLDDDTTLPTVDDNNLSEIGGEAINAQKDAILGIEQNLGLNVQGSAADLATRLSVFLEPSGNPKLSVLNTVGLVTLPITNAQVGSSAAISESKLALDHSTADLNSDIQSLEVDLQELQTWISTNGLAVVSHINGDSFRHNLQTIDVAPDAGLFLRNVFGNLLSNGDAYQLIRDINTEINDHRKKDGTGSGTGNITTVSGDAYPDVFAHPATSVFVDASRFNAFGNINSLQDLLEFLDNSSLLTFGGRIRNFYSNGISNKSSSSRLASVTEGVELIPTTTATTYLRNNGLSSIPFDDISNGDDIIEFKPSAGDKTSYKFDALFKSIRIGDIVSVNYGDVSVSFPIKEIKYDGSGSKSYAVRVFGRNIRYSTTAAVRVTKKLDNDEKFGVLSVAGGFTNYSSDVRGLVVVNPKSAMATGIGFDSNQFDSSHYNLYLVMYNDLTNLASGQAIFPIDVTGNQGATPGTYKLSDIVYNVNKAFRKIGVNSRFSAFEYKGEFGLACDPIGGTSFSIVAGVRGTNGAYNIGASNTNYPNNCIDTVNNLKDGLGLGPLGSGSASPVYSTSYTDTAATSLYTRIFQPLRHNNFYVGGNELDSLSKDFEQATDVNGDGYWTGFVQNQQFLGGRSVLTYRIEKNISTSNLSVGKSIVIQKKTAGNNNSFGRFIVSGISYYDCGCAELIYTDITVVDAVHNNNGVSGSSSLTGLATNDQVLVYFNNDSVSFSLENASDISPTGNSYRWFEVAVNNEGKTFSYERLRMFAGEEIINGYDFNVDNPNNAFVITNVSNKFKGYSVGINSFGLMRIVYDSTSGLVSANFMNAAFQTISSTYTGRVNQKLKVYSDSANDFVEIQVSKTASSFTGNYGFQLFPSIQHNSDFLSLAGVWVPLFTASQDLRVTKDLREFGNVAVKDLSTQSLNYISAVDAAAQTNGLINGFDVVGSKTAKDAMMADPPPTEGDFFMGAPRVNNTKIDLNGGQAIINGKIINKNAETFYLPSVSLNSGNANIFLCLTETGDYKVFVENTDPTVILSVINSDTNALFAMDNATLASLRCNKKLLPLYYINVTNPGNSYYVCDIRRYARSTDSLGGPTVDGSGDCFSFASVQAMINCATLDPDLGSVLHVKNTKEFIIPNGFGIPNYLYSSKQSVTIDGHNSTTLIVGGQDGVASLIGGVTYKNMNIMLFNGAFDANRLDISLDINFENVKFSNYSSDTINSGFAIEPITLNQVTNVTFKNCEFNFVKTGSTNNSYYPQFASVGVKLVAIVNKVLFDGCTFNSPIANLQNGKTNTAILASANQQAGTLEVRNSNFYGNYGKCVAFDHTMNDLVLDKNNFYAYSDYTSSTQWNADSTDILKAFEAKVYCFDLLATDGAGQGKSVLSNVKIINNSFSAIGTTKFVPSILIEGNRYVNQANAGTNANNRALVIQDMTIDNNKFYDTTANTAAMIAVVNSSNSGATGYYYNPTTAGTVRPFILDGLKITNNSAYTRVADGGTNFAKDRSRSIVITQSSPEKAWVLNNCSINNNTVGRIAVFGMSSTNISDSVGVELYKNYCYLIHQSDSKGQDFPLQSTSIGGLPIAEEYFPGNLSDLYKQIASYNISKNTLSWLTIPVNSNNCYSSISGNTFGPQDTTILDNYYGNNKNHTYVGNNIAMRILANNDATQNFNRQFINVNDNRVSGLGYTYKGYVHSLMTANFNNNVFYQSLYFDSYFALAFRGGNFTNNTVYATNLTATPFINDSNTTTLYSNNNWVGTVFNSLGAFGDSSRVFRDNVGQSNYGVISLNELKCIVNPQSSGAFTYDLLGPNTVGGIGANLQNSIYSSGYVSNGDTLPRVFHGMVNLSERLPRGVNITSVNFGAMISLASNIDAANSEITMSLYSPTISSLANLTNVTTALTGVDTTLTGSNVLTQSMNMTTLNNNKTSITTYINLTNADLSRFCSNHFAGKVVYLSIYIKMLKGSAFTTVNFSPIVITYTQGLVG